MVRVKPYVAVIVIPLPHTHTRLDHGYRLTFPSPQQTSRTYDQVAITRLSGNRDDLRRRRETCVNHSFLLSAFFYQHSAMQQQPVYHRPARRLRHRWLADEDIWDTDRGQNQGSKLTPPSFGGVSLLRQVGVCSAVIYTEVDSLVLWKHSLAAGVHWAGVQISRQPVWRHGTC